MHRIEQEYLRSRDVAAVLGISLSFAKKLIARREIASVRIGSAVRVPRSELERIGREGIEPERRTA